MSKIIIGLGNKCIDAAGANSVNGTPIVLWEQNGGTNQAWNLTPEGYIESTMDSNKCLDIQGGIANNGTPVILWEKTGGNNQKWAIDPNGFLTSALNPNKCIDVSGAENKNGTPLIIWDKNNGNNQKWHLQDLSTPPVTGHRVYPEGSLVQGANPAIYLIEAGKRRWIPDWETFLAMGFIIDRLLHISEPELLQIPVGDELPHAVRIAVTAKTHLKDNRWMESGISLLTSTGQLTGYSRTWSATWLIGFRGAAVVLGTDNNNDVLFARTQDTYANGTAFGASDNTIPWKDSIDVALAQRTNTLTIIHVLREVTNLDTFIKGLVQHGGTLAEFASKIAGVVKEFDSKSSTATTTPKP